MTLKRHLEDYNRLKTQVRENLERGSYSEQIVYKRLAMNYFDANNVEQVILKDARRGLLTLDPISGGMIIGVGSFEILPQQFIYGIQPYLHVEYNLRCLVMDFNENMSLEDRKAKAAEFLRQHNV